MPKKLIPHVYNTQLQKWVPCSSMSRTIKKPKATKTFKQVTKKKKTVAKKAPPKKVIAKKAPPKKVVAKKVVAKTITKTITPPAPKKACASPGA